MRSLLIHLWNLEDKFNVWRMQRSGQSNGTSHLLKIPDKHQGLSLFRDHRPAGHTSNWALQAEMRHRITLWRRKFRQQICTKNSWYRSKFQEKPTKDPAKERFGKGIPFQTSTNLLNIYHLSISQYILTWNSRFKSPCRPRSWAGAEDGMIFVTLKWSKMVCTAGDSDQTWSTFPNRMKLEKINLSNV